MNITELEVKTRDELMGMAKERGLTGLGTQSEGSGMRYSATTGAVIVSASGGTQPSGAGGTQRAFTSTGELLLYCLGVATALPAGAKVHNGQARTADDVLIVTAGAIAPNNLKMDQGRARTLDGKQSCREVAQTETNRCSGMWTACRMTRKVIC